MQEKETWPLLWVRWADSQYDSGWVPDDNYDEEESCECQSVGWRIRETKEAICLAQSLSRVGQPPNLTHCQRIWIPQRCILETREIED